MKRATIVKRLRGQGLKGEEGKTRMFLKATQVPGPLPREQRTDRKRKIERKRRAGARLKRVCTYIHTYIHTYIESGEV